jgi:hypothetical protein
MTKIATAAGTGNEVVGKVFILYGTVKAVSPDGTVHVLAPGSPIHAGEIIITESDGSVSIQFDGPHVTQLDLGRMTKIVIDEDVYAGIPHEAVSDAVAETEQIQEFLLDGDKPIELEATAAGGSAGAGGGLSVFTLAPDGHTIIPVSGADTPGITTPDGGTTGSIVSEFSHGVGGPSIPLVTTEVDNHAMNGSGIHTDLAVSQGDVITFSWSFDADDYTPFNDFGFVVIDGKTIKLADISQVGGDNATAWRTFTYEATADGPLHIGFGAMNTGDEEGNSHLLVDKLAVNGEVVQSFESGDFSGWESAGNVAAVASHDEGGGTPTDGHYMARITTAGSDVTEGALESFFDLGEGTLDVAATARLGTMAWATLDDEGLTHGIPDGEGDILVNPDPDYNEATFSGTLPHDFGPDGVGSVTFAAMHGQTGLVGIEEATYSWDSNANTLTAIGPRGALFTVEVNPATGDYTATVIGNILHAPPVDGQAAYENNAYIQQLTYTVTDADGDQINGTFNIMVNDDTPVATDQTTASLSGAIGSFGADGGHVLSIAGVDGGTIDSEITPAAGDYDLQVTGEFGGILQVDSSDGHYLYTPPTAGSSTDKVHEIFDFTIIDGDGDTASAQLSMLIDDPHPLP